ncbi:hypothetical protein ACFYT4_27925 [Streptomyces sp. NPDC004609]|uniref:hypothetical protein n=1 Tax=Streptomyces sp. NPDC004609 TaxID=3364704 RepID=UPI00369F94E7
METNEGHGPDQVLIPIAVVCDGSAPVVHRMCLSVTETEHLRAQLDYVLNSPLRAKMEERLRAR